MNTYDLALMALARAKPVEATGLKSIADILRDSFPLNNHDLIESAGTPAQILCRHFLSYARHCAGGETAEERAYKSRGVSTHIYSEGKAALEKIEKLERNKRVTNTSARNATARQGTGATVPA